MDLRVTCGECHQPLQFSLDYPDGLKIEPCECATGISTIEDLKEELKDAESEIEHLKRENEDYEKTIETREAEISDGDVAIENLKSQIEDLNHQIQELSF